MRRARALLPQARCNRWAAFLRDSATGFEYVFGTVDPKKEPSVSTHNERNPPEGHLQRT